MSIFEIKGLVASVAGKQILRGIDLTLQSGEVHAVMGPNGAGKSTLAGVIMGKPGYEVLAGSITLDGVDVLAMAAWERAVAGLHLVMQYPTEVPGVMLDDVLDEVLGDAGGVTGVRLRDVVSGATREVPVHGTFIAIGHTPNTAFLNGQLASDENGYLLLTDFTRTSVDGVFACGDIADTRYRQAITAAGNGCQAAIDAEKWLEEHAPSHG